MKWDELDMGMEILGGRRTLSLDEQEALFRRGLKDELARATVHITAPEGAERSSPVQHKVLAAAYRVIARIPADASSIDAAVLDAVVTPEWSDEERRLLRKALELIVTPACVSPSTAMTALAEIDAPMNEGTMKEARAQILRGYVEAQDRAELINHQLIRARGGSPQWLLDDIFVAELRQNAVRCGDVPAARIAAAAPASTTVPQAPAEPVVHSIYLTPSTMRFSEIIGPTLQSLKDKNKWKDDLRQRTAIAERFAWVTGDKPLCEYTETDIEDYVKALRLKPDWDPVFVEAFLRSRTGRQELEKRKSGTTSVWAVYWSQLKTLKIPKPSREEQASFRAFVEAIWKKADLLREDLQKMEHLFASLQHRAFRGEL